MFDGQFNQFAGHKMTRFCHMHLRCKQVRDLKDEQSVVLSPYYWIMLLIEFI